MLTVRFRTANHAPKPKSMGHEPTPNVTRHGFWGLADIDSALLYRSAEIAHATERALSWEAAMRACAAKQSSTLYRTKIVGGYRDDLLIVDVEPKHAVLDALLRALNDARSARILDE